MNELFSLNPGQILEPAKDTVVSVANDTFEIAANTFGDVQDFFAARVEDVFAPPKALEKGPVPSRTELGYLMLTVVLAVVFLSVFSAANTSV